VRRESEAPTVAHKSSERKNLGGRPVGPETQAQNAIIDARCAIDAAEAATQRIVERAQLRIEHAIRVILMDASSEMDGVKVDFRERASAICRKLPEAA
jgi:hypothetical protein